jgi:hypothetical protein
LQGQWSYIDLLPSETNTPGEVMLSVMTLSADGTARFDYSDLLDSTTIEPISVTGKAVYSNSQDRLLIGFNGGTDPYGLLLGQILEFSSPRVRRRVMTYGGGGTMFSSPQGLEQPGQMLMRQRQGVWLVNEANWLIDFIVFSQTGYGVLQTRDEQGNPKLIDFYATTDTPQNIDGAVTLHLFVTNPETVTDIFVFDSVTVGEGDGSLLLRAYGDSVRAPRL